MKVDLLGVQIDNLSLQEVLEKVKVFLASKHQHFIVTPNPEFLVAAESDKQFKEILNYADLAIADGIGLIKAAKWQGKSLQRVTGVDLIWAIPELAQEEENNWPIFLLGAEEGVADAAAQRLIEEFPNLNIAGTSSGGEIDLNQTDYELISQINAVKPKVLFVAFGQIKQEKWIFKNLDKLPSVKLAIGVGGAFDYVAGDVPRAPQILRKLGLEWLFRLIQEPTRWKRIYTAVIIFPFLVIKNRLNPRKE